MCRDVVRFSSLLFTALTLAPAMAHLLEMGHKLGLSREQYLTVQQIYAGWAWLGVVILLALLSNLALAVVTRRNRGALRWAVLAALAIVGAQVVFWVWTFPANQQTANWTTLPENWQALRTRWEYSHAAGAVLNLVALVGVIVAVLKDRDVARSGIVEN